MTLVPKKWFGPMRWLSTLAASWMGMAAITFAASPIVETIQPAGMQRGGELELTLSGVYLADAKGILTVDDRIKLVEVVKAEAKKVTLKISADKSMPPGLYPFWFVTESGVSNLRLLSVGAMPVVEETEPNSVFETAQTLALNSTVNGVVAREDVDYYRVDLKAGQRLKR